MHRDELSVRKRRFIRGLGLLGAGLLGLVAPRRRARRRSAKFIA
jgi:hypothetical protein